MKAKEYLDEIKCHYEKFEHTSCALRNFEGSCTQEILEKYKNKMRISTLNLINSLNDYMDILEEE